MANYLRYALATICFAASVGCLAFWFTLSEFGRAIIFPLWYPALVLAISGVAVIRFSRQFTIRSAFVVTTVFVALAAMLARIAERDT